MQEGLCQKFGERFPWRTATLTIGGKLYDEFSDMPFSAGPPEETCEVKFEATSDMYWIDVLYRNPKARNTSLGAELNQQVQQPLAEIPGFPTVAPPRECTMM